MLCSVVKTLAETNNTHETFVTRLRSVKSLSVFGVFTPNKNTHLLINKVSMLTVRRPAKVNVEAADFSFFFFPFPHFKYSRAAKKIPAGNESGTRALEKPYLICHWSSSEESLRSLCNGHMNLKKKKKQFHLAAQGWHIWENGNVCSRVSLIKTEAKVWPQSGRALSQHHTWHFETQLLCFSLCVDPQKTHNKGIFRPSSKAISPLLPRHCWMLSIAVFVDIGLRGGWKL